MLGTFSAQVNNEPEQAKGLVVTTQAYRFGDCHLIPSTREVYCDGKPVNLTGKVFDTLLYILRNRDRVVTREELLRELWAGRVVEESNVTQAIYVLRRALSPGIADSRLIVTVSRVGYRFVPDVDEIPIHPACLERPEVALEADARNPALDRIALSPAVCLEKGRAQLAQRAPANLLAAIEWFRNALVVDPASAAAFVGLASSYSLLSLYGGLGTPHETYPLARAAAQRALEIDSSLAAAYTALGVVQHFYDWDWSAACRSFQRAVELDPAAAEPRYRWGTCLLSLGQFSEARTQFDAAIRNDPLSLIIKTFASYPDYYERRYESAISSLRKSIQLDPKFPMARYRLGLALTQAGRFAEGISELSMALRFSGGDKDNIAALAYARGRSGDTDGARTAVHELTERSSGEFTSGYPLALAQLGLGNVEEALRRAVEQRSYWMIYIAIDPALDCVRGEKGFADLLHRVVTVHREIDQKTCGLQTSLQPQRTPHPTAVLRNS